VYGDAENEEHIKLARVLMDLLLFTEEDAAPVLREIDNYTASWWHSAGNLLKVSTIDAKAASSGWGAWFGGAPAASDAPPRAPATAPRPTRLPTRRPGS